MTVHAAAGGVQVVLVPYNPYNYSKHAARAGPYPSAPRGAPQKPISPLNPAGLYTGPTYNDQYLQGHYMIPASPPYEQYNGYSHHPYAVSILTSARHEAGSEQGKILHLKWNVLSISFPVTGLLNAAFWQSYLQQLVSMPCLFLLELLCQ